MKLLRYTIIFLVLVANSGIGNTPGKETAEDDDIVELRFAAPKKPKSEINDLKRKARKGDGEAAFALFGYYALSVEGNAKKAERYFQIALECKYPNALYNKAFDIWVYEENPDIKLVESLLREAMKRGFVDERGLLDEVLEAKSSGKIPNNSKFRYFPEKIEEAEQVAGGDATR
ncbi:MAG: hypothetical protein AB3N10_10205 [Allomuricauda sp.]